jgi:hypothetical protein
MKTLPIEFTKTQDSKKVIFRQLQSVPLEGERRLYVYGLFRLDQDIPYAYEVFIPRIQKKDVAMPTNGYVSAAGEKYPGATDFGPRALYIGGIGSNDDKLRRVEEAKGELIESFTKAQQKLLIKLQNKQKKEQDANNAN